MAVKKVETTVNESEVLDSKENESKLVKEEVKSPVSEIDISSIIKQAISEALKESQAVIDEQASKIKELENKISVSDQGQSTGFNSNKRVKIMHMGVGSANFSKGRINVNFEEPFETRDVRYDIFEEMYDLYGDWFRNFELVILDKDVREYVGLEHTFKEYGADKNTFYEILRLKANDCLARLDKLKPMVAMTFLKFFIEEYLNHNPDALPKFGDITEFYKSRYGINEMQSSIAEMTN